MTEDLGLFFLLCFVMYYLSTYSSSVSVTYSIVCLSKLVILHLFLVVKQTLGRNLRGKYLGTVTESHCLAHCLANPLTLTTNIFLTLSLLPASLVFLIFPSQILFLPPPTYTIGTSLFCVPCPFLFVTPDRQSVLLNSVSIVISVLSRLLFGLCLWHQTKIDLACFIFPYKLTANQNFIREKITSSLGNAQYHSVQNLLSHCLLSKNVKIKIYKTKILPIILRTYMCMKHGL
jgi:hypothetical protein